MLDLEKRVGLDLDPKYEGILTQNFLDYIPTPAKTYLSVGNPPFGKISSTAIKFFNKCAEFSNVIAFIIPRTFRRVSVQNKLNLHFKIIHDETLSTKPCCFSPNMSAKCCFQIWVRDDINIRSKVLYSRFHPDFEFVKLGPKDVNGQPTPPIAHFALKAYGSNCGSIQEVNLEKLRPKSWHWIKANIDVNTLKINFSKIDYSMSKNTVRQDSLGQQDLIHLSYNTKNTTCTKKVKV